MKTNWKIIACGMLAFLGGVLAQDAIAGNTSISLQSIVITDPSPGSNDGFIHPGQTIQLAPVFENLLNTTIAGVTVQVTTTSSLATVESPSTIAVSGSVASSATFSPSANFKIAVSAGATDSQAIPINFVVSYSNGTAQQQTISYTLYVTVVIQAQTQVNFQIGAVLSDPNRDLAYVVDITDQELLAINTTTGTVATRLKLAASAAESQLALSADGSHLYVALTEAEQIQVVSLPSLEQSDLINLNFQPYSLAAGSDGNLYAILVNGSVTSTPLRQINPNTGTILASFGETEYGQYLLRTSDDYSILGTEEVSVSGFVGLDTYVVNSSGVPAEGTAIDFDDENFFDLAIDTTYQRIYTAQGGVYGVGVTSLSTGTTTTWPDGDLGGGPYGCAVCFLPTGNFVYGGAYGSIRRYNRFDGTPLADFIFSGENVDLMGQGLAINANGNVLYAASEWTGEEGVGINGYFYYLGLIGHSTLTIGATSVAPTVYAGVDLTYYVSQVASLSATSGSLPITWSQLSGPPGAIITPGSNGTATVSFSTPGAYQIVATATSGTLTGSDIVNITVLPEPTPPTITSATQANFVVGQADSFTVTATGNPAPTFSATGLPSWASLNPTTGVLSGTPPNASGSPFSINITAANGNLPNATQTFTLNVQSPEGFGPWETSEDFTGGATVIGPTDTPESDGVPNLLKYLFNIDPATHMSATDYAALPVVGTTTISGTKYLTLTYRQFALKTGITINVQTSPDLLTWTTVVNPTIIQTGNDPSTGDPMMQVQVPFTGTEGFVRFDVTSP